MSTATRRFISGYGQCTKTVAASKAATQGYLLIPSGAGTVENATSACDTGAYVALETASAGNRVEVHPLGAGCVAVKVGTGGATRGKAAIWSGSDDGFCDAPAMANGSTHTSCYGVFEDSGIAGDVVGLVFCRFEREST